MKYWEAYPQEVNVADLPTLQKAIDEKNIDTRKLSSEQLQALDQAFKSGELTGYDSVKDLFKNN